MYPLGSPTTNLDFTNLTSSLPTQLYIETPAQWSMVNDAISTLFPGLSSTGCLKSATTFPGGSGPGVGGSGGAANYVTFKNSDGNDGNSHWSGQFYLDASANPTADEYYAHLLVEDGFQPIATSGTGQLYGASFEISPIYKQAQSLSSLRTTITPNPRGLVYFPTNIPSAQFYGLYTDRVYEVHVLTHGNTIRVGIKDIHPTGPGATSNSDGAAINGYLSVIGETSVGDEFTKNWKYTSGNYNLTYHSNFHSVIEFQSSHFMTPKRVGFQFEQYHAGKWYIGNMSNAPWEEFVYPKFITPPDNTNLTGGYLRSDAYYNSQLSPITCLTGITQTTVQLTARAPLGSPTSVTYQWKRSTTPGGTFTNVGTSSLVLSDTGLTANTLYYWQLFATGRDANNTLRTVAYPQFAVKTLNTSRAAQSWYVDSAAVTNGIGTSLLPFKTLANLIAGAAPWVPGDQVFLVSGSGHAVYQGPLTIQNATGLPTSYITFTSTNLSFPAQINNFGSQFASGNGIELIDCSWVSVKGINVQGPGLLQLPGSGSDFEANGTTIVGAGGTATRTSTAGNGVLLVGTQNTWLPLNRSGQVFQPLLHVSVPSYYEIDEDYAGLTGDHGEDKLWHKSQGNIIDTVNVTGMYLGIVAYAPGTHEDRNTSTATGTHVPPYQIRFRQGQEFLVVQNCTVKDVAHTGFWTCAEMFHSDPTFDQTSNRKTINPTLSPYDLAVYDPTDTTGLDAVATALFGQGSYVRANLCNAGPGPAYNGTTNVVTLQNLNDHPMAAHHSAIVLLNCGFNNIPGDNFYGASGLLLYNSGAGVGANNYQGMPGGQSGFGVNCFCTSGILVYGGYVCNNGRTDRGSAGPIGILYQNMSYAWTENLFLHDCKGPSDGGALDWDGRVYYGVWKGIIGCNNGQGFAELTGYGAAGNAHANCTFIGCASLDYSGGGLWINSLPTAGHRDTFLNCFLHDDTAVHQTSNPGALEIVNCVWTGNSSAAMDTATFNNAQHVHQIHNTYIYNYGAGAVTISNFDKVGVVTTNPGFPNDTPGGHFVPSYPQLVVNTNGTNAPDLSAYSYTFAKTFTNWIPTTSLGSGIDPATVGVRYPAAARTDITGTALSGGYFPIGVYGIGSIALSHKSLLLLGVG